MSDRLSLLILASPDAPLGSGQAGGVEHTVILVAKELARRGHSVTVVAPRGSSPIPLVSMIEIDGKEEEPAQVFGRKSLSTIHPTGVLARSWEYAELHKYNLDIVLCFSYNWLSFYITPFLKIPVAHFVTKPSLLDSIDKAMMHTARKFPGSIGFHTQAQAETFPHIPSPHVLGGGIDLSTYHYNDEADPVVGWVGRIAPEKGLEDAVEIASRLNVSLRVIGKLEDPEYWRYIIERYPQASVQYLGFLGKDKLQQEIRKLQTVLMTHRWVEPLGTVALEALACGVPVVSYARGGPTEFIEHGQTGFLVQPDNIDELVEAVRATPTLSRRSCRLAAERLFSAEAFCTRIEAWLYQVIEKRHEFDALDAAQSKNSAFPQRRG